MCVCVCVCVRERERVRWEQNRCLRESERKSQTQIHENLLRAKMTKYFFFQIAVFRSSPRGLLKAHLNGTKPDPELSKTASQLQDVVACPIKLVSRKMSNL